MGRRATIALAGLVVSMVAAHGCHRSSPPPVQLALGPGGPLAFPPPDDGWADRKPLAADAAPGTLLADTALRVTSPALDDHGHFETKGQVLRLWFNEPVIDEHDVAKAPAVAITPEVRGKTIWTHGTEVEFHADKPFDPDVEYTLTLPEMTGPSGKKLAGGFRATFKAQPIVEVAGKTIYYVPKPGHARVVAITPSDETMLGGSQDVFVVYDQPIDLGVARRLVRLVKESPNPSDKAAAPILADAPFTVAHPPKSAFEGQKVDPRFVVVVHPAARLAPEERFSVIASPQVQGEDEPKQQGYAIATPTKVEEAGCVSGTCDVTGNTIVGSSSSSLHVRYSNPLGGDARGRVHITPEPKNLYVSGWEELSISASFAPSTTYSIRIDAIRDRYGGTSPPTALTFTTRALPASATMSEGVQLLDEGTTHAYPVTTRNVERAELRLWPVEKGDVGAYAQALKDARASTTPATPPTVVAVAPRTKRDELGDTLVDLSPHVERGRAYIAQLAITKATAGAATADVPAGSEAAHPATAVVFAAGKSALAAHVHRAGEKAVVQVMRLASGEPVAGARVAIGTASGETDANGVTTLAVPRLGPADVSVLSVQAEDSALMLPISVDKETHARALYSELTSTNDDEPASEAVGMIVTDRGVYRPGSSMQVKALLRRQQDGAIRALANTKVRLRVVDPTNQDITDEALVTDARGAIARSVSFEKKGHTGRHHVRLELDDGKHTLVTEETVRVAEFETPRFKVDVEPRGEATPAKLEARIVGRYLFGAAMTGAKATWVVKQTRASVKGGALAEAGLVFDEERSWWDEAQPRDVAKPLTGEGELDADGVLPLDVAIGAATGPTEVLLEADVTDQSNRHVSGQLRTARDPFPRHAGLKVKERFADVGRPVHVELGAVDQAGRAVVGATVEARLERLVWSQVSTRAESGATVSRWASVPKVESTCSVTTAEKPVACELPVVRGGDYRIVARIDGRTDASTSFWAYGSYGRDDDAVPSEGKKVPLVLDRAKYKAGDTAKLLVRSPFARATALVTYEQGGIVRSEARRIEGRSATFDVPISGVNAPWMHAAVTLLPLGQAEADYRVGVVRIPVGTEDSRVDVRVSSAKKEYGVREDAEITIEVKRDGAPVANADVTLGVVDEGVLRMTSYHPRDPATALRPGRSLDFAITDSRAAMLRRRERAHVAGDGDGGEASLDTRKNFVETAAFLTNLVTDGEGRVRTKVRLPDNLTEMRMTAVVVDDVGRGGVGESSFVVTKPTLLEPIMPRFAAKGDRFEAAAMVHNNTTEALAAKVTVAGQERDVTLPPKGRVRVAVPMSADRSGTRKMHFAVAVGGAVKDDVVVPFRVDSAGIDEHPMLSGVFGAEQRIDVAIPADALFDDDAYLTLKTGSALYPELGHRLSFLLDYPHGCVEQTTSSTIPLLAARTILPWTGTTGLDDAELQKRIDAGVTRLASMQTTSGGLAYWPGGDDPNVYGTTYALRALLRARDIGIERPRLIAGVTKYLTERLGREPNADVRVAIAEVLAQAKELPESSADALFDLREKLDAYGAASLALALASLPKQEDRVRELVDAVEAAFDESGTPKKAHDKRDWHYWGSDDRDRAQSLIALTKLRPSSKVVPVLASRLARGVDRWTTQSTAWSLLALADYMGTRSPNGGVDVRVKLEGVILDTFARLGGDNKEVHVPLKDLAGRKVALFLTGDKATPSAFALEARYKRPLEGASTRLGRRGPSGISIHRAYSDAAGKPIDLAKVKVGQLVRVALRMDMPKLESYRLGYLAITDRLPAGFEPINSDLSTSGTLPELAKEHPFHEGLSQGGASPTHMDLRDDRVQLYFDRVWTDEALYASYLARATTQGSFVLPPANGELMYEPGSEGYSDAGKVTVE